MRPRAWRTSAKCSFEVPDLLCCRVLRGNSKVPGVLGSQAIGENWSTAQSKTAATIGDAMACGNEQAQFRKSWRSVFGEKMNFNIFSRTDRQFYLIWACSSPNAALSVCTAVYSITCNAVWLTACRRHPRCVVWQLVCCAEWESSVSKNLKSSFFPESSCPFAIATAHRANTAS